MWAILRPKRIWIPLILLGITGIAVSLGLAKDWPQIAASLSLIFVGYLSISLLIFIKWNEWSKFSGLGFGLCLWVIISLTNVSIWVSSYKWIYAVEAGLLLFAIVIVVLNYKYIKNLDTVEQKFFKKEVIIFLLILTIFMTIMNVLYFEDLFLIATCIGAGFFVTLLIFGIVLKKHKYNLNRKRSINDTER